MYQNCVELGEQEDNFPSLVLRKNRAQFRLAVRDRRCRDEWLGEQIGPMNFSNSVQFTRLFSRPEADQALGSTD
jgi:hypothetical protein